MPGGSITKKDLASKTHRPHGGSKDSNEHAAGNKDGATLRRLNATIANAEKKRADLEKKAAAAQKKAGAKPAAKGSQKATKR